MHTSRDGGAAAGASTHPVHSAGTAGAEPRVPTHASGAGGGAVVSSSSQRGASAAGGGQRESASSFVSLPGATAPAAEAGGSSVHANAGAAGAGAGAMSPLGVGADALGPSQAPAAHTSTLGLKPSTASMRALTRGLTDGQKLRIRAAFDTFDNDGTGFITAKDLRPLLQYLGDHPSSKELQELIILVDADGNGVIDFQEFMTLVVMRSRHAHAEAQVVEAFQMFDEHGTGTVPASRVRHALRHLIGMRESQIDLMIQEAVAVSGDPEHIHYREFVRHLMRDF